MDSGSAHACRSFVAIESNVHSSIGVACRIGQSARIRRTRKAVKIGTGRVTTAKVGKVYSIKSHASLYIRTTVNANERAARAMGLAVAGRVIKFHMHERYGAVPGRRLVTRFRLRSVTSLHRIYH